MKKRDLTNGNITLQLAELMLPLLLGNILQQLYNTVDAFIIGRCCGEGPYAAIGVAGTVMNLFLFAAALLSGAFVLGGNVCRSGTLCPAAAG